MRLRSARAESCWQRGRTRERRGCGMFNRSVRFWNPGTCEPHGEPFITEDRLVSLTFSPDGKQMATGSGSVAQLWDVTTRKRLGKPQRRGGVIRGVQFCPDGKRWA